MQLVYLCGFRKRIVQCKVPQIVILVKVCDIIIFIRLDLWDLVTWDIVPALVLKLV